MFSVGVTQFNALSVKYSLAEFSFLREMTQWFFLIKCPSPHCERHKCFSPVPTVSFMCQDCSGIILGPLRGESLILLICSDVRVKERYHLQNSRAASNARFVSQRQGGPSWRRAVWRSTWGVVFILFEDFWFQVSHVLFCFVFLIFFRMTNIT